MNCEEFRRVVLELPHLEAGEVEAIAAHLAICQSSECQTQWENTLHLNSVIDQWRRQTPQADFTDRILADLHSETLVRLETTGRASRVLSKFRMIVLGSVAACLMLAIGVYRGQSNGPLRVAISEFDNAPARGQLESVSDLSRESGQSQSGEVATSGQAARVADIHDPSLELGKFYFVALKTATQKIHGIVEDIVVVKTNSSDHSESGDVAVEEHELSSTLPALELAHGNGSAKAGSSESPFQSFFSGQLKSIESHLENTQRTLIPEENHSHDSGWGIRNLFQAI